MADGLILEFDGLSTDTYERVNEALGIEMETGEGDWPAGLISHTGAAADNGFVVFEVWRSKADQERFMDERLGAALQAGGVDGPPSRVEWLDLAAHHERPEQV
ncbi:MAG: hypothetical protein JST31_16990 [Actinobacteria bacterium]|nr:hypothetical protein [Actinomycetota bacterium]